MHYRQIVILVVCCLVALGIYSLPEMRKNEFPDLRFVRDWWWQWHPAIPRRRWWSG